MVFNWLTTWRYVTQHRLAKTSNDIRWPLSDTCFLFPPARKYETFIRGNAFLKKCIHILQDDQCAVLETWSVLICLRAVLFTPIFSNVHMHKWGQIIYLTPFFLFSCDQEVASVCAITTCSNELLFPVKNSTESTCCLLKIMHPNQIVSLHGSRHVFTHSRVALECCSEWCNKLSIGIKADIPSVKKTFKNVFWQKLG